MPSDSSRLRCTIPQTFGLRWTAYQDAEPARSSGPQYPAMPGRSPGVAPRSSHGDARSRTAARTQRRQGAALFLCSSAPLALEFPRVRAIRAPRESAEARPLTAGRRSPGCRSPGSARKGHSPAAGLAGTLRRREMQVGDAPRHASIDLFREELPLVPGAQTRLDVTHLGPGIKDS